MKLNLIKKMKEENIIVTQELLEREAWRLILLSSQKHFLFKKLGKYNLVEVQGIKCKLTTSEPLGITLLGTDKSPIVSNKDPISRLIMTKAHVRDTHISVHPIHSTASTTLSKIMTGCYEILLVNGEDAVQEYMKNCMTCKKMHLLHYVSPIGMTLSHLGL